MSFLTDAGKGLVTVLGKTWRISRIRPQTGIGNRRTLYAFWHGNQLPLLFTNRNRGVTVMVSRSRDGGLVASLLQSMGFRTVRGSSSSGGIQAASLLVRALRHGSGAITPDGPRGPREVPKQGMFRIAGKAQVSITAMGAAAWPALRLGSWDRFLIPLPGSRVAVADGIPIPSGRISESTVAREMRRVSSTAELAVSPVASLQAMAAGTACLAAMPLLLFRPARERRERLGGATPATGRPAWLHGSSLGELRGLLPVAEKLAKRGVPVYFTCFTPSGRNFIDSEGFEGSFLPLDTPACVQRFISRVRPRCLILAETELWPSLLRETVLHGIPACMVNARMSRRSLRGYSFIRRLVTGCLSCFAGILARTGEDAAAFMRLGVPGALITVAGDGKAAVRPEGPDPSWKGMLAAGEPYLVAGSTRQGEEEFVLAAARAAGMRVILAPRHADRLGEVVARASGLGWTPVLFSRCTGPAECLILDVQGVLPRIYPLGRIAFLGGTVAPVGGHNILEPLSQGLPVVVGPRHENHAAIVEEGERIGVVKTVHNPSEMALILREWNGKADMSAAARNLALSENALFDRELTALLEGMML